MRIGLVGTGGVAHNHIAGYRAILGERAVVTAACDPRADVLAEFCAKYDIPQAFPDATALFASGDVDVAVVLTRPEIREEVIQPALDAKVALLIEKPFGQSFGEAARYVEQAEKAGVPLAVSQNFRWFPEHQWMKKQLADPRMGEPRYLQHDVFQDRRQPPGVWRADQHRLEMAIFSVHLIDRLQWLAEHRPQAVAAVTRRDESGDLPGEQFTTLIVQFEGGAVGQMTSNWMSKGLPMNTTRVDCVNASIEVSRPAPMSGDAIGRVQLHNEEVATEQFLDRREVRDGARSYGHSLQAFVEAIDRGVEAPHSGRNNLRTMAIMDAAYLSAARGGALVSIDEVCDGFDLERTSNER